MLAALREGYETDVVCDVYAEVINKMMDFYFSSKADYGKEFLIEMFGSFGTIYTEKVKEGLKAYRVREGANVLIEKLQFVDNVVQTILTGNYAEMPIYNEHLNSFRILVYFSENILKLKSDNVTYLRKRHMVNGFDINPERIWLCPDMLLNFDSMGMNIIDLTKFIEENENLKLGLDGVGPLAHGCFNNEEITGVSFFRLVANGYLKFAVVDIDHYIVEVDALLQNNFSS